MHGHENAEARGPLDESRASLNSTDRALFPRLALTFAASAGPGLIHWTGVQIVVSLPPAVPMRRPEPMSVGVL